MEAGPREENVPAPGAGGVHPPAAMQERLWGMSLCSIYGRGAFSEHWEVLF